MTILKETIGVGESSERAFDAIADFSTSAEWDPGVVAARRVRDGRDAPNGIGAEYALTVTFRGRSSDMTYRTTAYEPSRLVVLEGVGPKIRATDTIELEPLAAGGTRITYTADLPLSGATKLAQPLLSGAFVRMGHRALEGMRAWFERRTVGQ